MNNDGDPTAITEATSTVQNQVPNMTFAPPLITASMMPRPNPSVEKQSAEEWFKVFKIVAESVIGIYRAANQEIIGQRPALATLPSLLNRNESELRLATRILAECATIDDAEALISRTIGDLESECQAAEIIFDSKRGTKSLEDYYALLAEKEKKGKIGNTNLIKKFITTLPGGMKTTVQRKFAEFRRNTPNGELRNEDIEALYVLSRQLYNEKFRSAEEKNDNAFTVTDKEKQTEMNITDLVKQQNETIKGMQEQLEAFLVDDRRRAPDARRRKGDKRPTCYHCNKPGHLIKDCWLKQEEEHKAKSKYRDSGYCTLEKEDSATVVIEGIVEGKKAKLLVDTGAGPCIISLKMLQTLGINNKIDINKAGKTLNGLGKTKSIESVKLNIKLHPQLHCDQEFTIVDNMDVILLGRKFLSRFDSLSVN